MGNARQIWLEAVCHTLLSVPFVSINKSNFLTPPLHCAVPVLQRVCTSSRMFLPFRNINITILSLLVASLAAIASGFEISLTQGGQQMNGLSVSGDFKPSSAAGFAQLTENVPYGSKVIRANNRASNVKSWNAQIDCSFGPSYSRRSLQGLAFWVTKESLPATPVAHSSSVFGMPSKWNGLGIFVEPKEDSGIIIKAVWNNGTTDYNPAKATGNWVYHFVQGEHSIDKQTGRFQLQIEYTESTLTVYIGQREVCLQSKKLVLSGYEWFAISGAASQIRTGQHIQLYSFSVKGDTAVAEKPILDDYRNIWKDSESAYGSRYYQHQAKVQDQGSNSSDSLLVAKLQEQLRELETRLALAESKLAMASDSLNRVVAQQQTNSLDVIDRRIGEHAERIFRDKLAQAYRTVDNATQSVGRMEERVNAHQQTIAAIQRDSKLDAAAVAKRIRWIYWIIFGSSILTGFLLVRPILLGLPVMGRRGGSGEAPKKFI